MHAGDVVSGDAQANTTPSADALCATTSRTADDTATRATTAQADGDDDDGGAHERGVCPVKAAYRCAAPVRVSLDSDGRTRGMNRATERARSTSVSGTLRPTLEGECNVLCGEALQRIKAVVRGKANRRGVTNDTASTTTSTTTDAQAGSASASVENNKSSSSSDVADTSKRARIDDDDNNNEDGSACVMSTCTAAAPLLLVSAAATCTAADGGDANTTTATTTSGGSRNDEGDESGGGGDRVRERFARQRARARGLFADKLILAPLTTVGNLPFRRVCKSFGADVTMSEMALVPNLLRMQKSEWALLRRHACEDVFGIQVAVGRPHDAALLARALAASGFAYDFVDVNCGCPVDAIVRSGCGCGLADRKGRLRAVVQQLAMAQAQPVTIKCRLGADEAQPSLHTHIADYADYGAAAVTVHGRSRRQRYTRQANWDYVQQCAMCTSLPVIGNGDILGYEDVVQHRRTHTGVCAYMIGRGALIKPWIFDEIKTGQVRDMHSSERLDMLQTFCRYGLAHWGADVRGVMTTRRYLCEWLSFLHRYVPVALLERLPQRINERPPHYFGRDDLETLMASDSVADWVRITEMLLGPAEAGFRFTPKHKSNSYTTQELTTSQSGNDQVTVHGQQQQQQQGTLDTTNNNDVSSCA